MMIDKNTTREAIRFAMVGIFATALHYGIYAMLMNIIQIDVAYTTGYVISFLANFYLTSYFTFKVKPSWKKLTGMGGAHLVNYLLHMILLHIFLTCGIAKQWAPIPVFAIAIPTNFILVRFVFKSRKL